MNLTEQTITINGLEAVYYECGSGEKKALFFGGNGMPIGVYSPLISVLSQQLSLTCLELRPCWNNVGSPKGETNWKIYTDDLIAFIEKKYDEPITLIGHSQGAHAAVKASIQRPDLFKKLILIEPASVSKSIEWQSKVVPFFIKKFFEPIKGASKKPDHWESVDAYYQYLRNNRGYRRISDEHLMVFAKECLTKNGDGYKLKFSSAWETANFAKPHNLNKPLSEVPVPFNILLGKPSIFVDANVRKQWQSSFLKEGQLQVNEQYGHLIPIEDPEFTAGFVLGVFNQL